MPLAARHFELTREFALPRAAVWQVLAKTEKINRAIGLAPVEYGQP